jgi:hypothetical protein
MALVVAWLGCSMALAVAADVDTGIRAYEALDFRGARAALERAIADPGLGGEERRRALAHLARVLAVLDDAVGAQRCFEDLLVLQPEHTVSWRESPRIRAAFAAATAAVAARGGAAAPAGPGASVGSTELPSRTAPLLPVEDVPRRTTPARPKQAAQPGLVAPTPSASELRPARPTPTGPAPAEHRGKVWWWVAGGIVVIGGIVAGIALATAGDGEPNAGLTATWRLP